MEWLILLHRSDAVCGAVGGLGLWLTCCQCLVHVLESRSLSYTAVGCAHAERQPLQLLVLSTPAIPRQVYACGCSIINAFSFAFYLQLLYGQCNQGLTQRTVCASASQATAFHFAARWIVFSGYALGRGWQALLLQPMLHACPTRVVHAQSSERRHNTAAYNAKPDVVRHSNCC